MSPYRPRQLSSRKQPESKRRRVSPPSRRSTVPRSTTPPPRDTPSRTVLPPSRTPPINPTQRISRPQVRSDTATAKPSASRTGCEASMERVGVNEGRDEGSESSRRIELVHDPMRKTYSEEVIQAELAHLRRRLRRDDETKEEEEENVGDELRKGIEIVRGGSGDVGGQGFREEVVREGLQKCVDVIEMESSGVGEFVKCGGVQAVVDVMGKGLETGEGWDMRAKCMELLGLVMAEDESVSGNLRFMQARGMEKREGGAVGLLVDLLEEAGRGVLGGEEAGGSGEERRIDRRERDRKWDMVGRVCRVVKKAANQSVENAKLIRASMPRKVYLALSALSAGSNSGEGRGSNGELDVHEKLRREFAAASDKMWTWRWGW